VSHADAGETAEATKVLEHLRQRQKDEFVSASFLANVYVRLGQADDAFAALLEKVGLDN
jgi:predicted Zn-dependent protease